MILNLRKSYKDKELKTKKYDNLEKFFSKVIEFSRKANSNEIKKEFASKFEGDYRVWLLFAKNDNESWRCLQVAHSKNSVQVEIEDVIQCLLCGYSIDFTNVTYSNSAFYEKVCPKVTNKKEYNKFLYSKIRNEYKNFRLCLLDVDSYLGIEADNNSNSTDSKRIIQICKNQYAEAKIAYQT